MSEVGFPLGGSDIQADGFSRVSHLLAGVVSCEVITAALVTCPDLPEAARDRLIAEGQAAVADQRRH